MTNQSLKIFGTLLFLFVSMGLYSQKTNALPEVLKKVDSFANFTIENKLIPSLSIAIMKGDEMIFEKAYGKADIGFDVSATVNTKYRLIGPTVTVLSALVMKEVEKGNLFLDQDVTKLLPEFPWQGKKMTLQNLLNVTSGLQDYHYLGDNYRVGIGAPKTNTDVTELFAGKSFTHNPGEKQQWTISGYHLAGVILERVTGKNFGELIQQEITDKLNLENFTHNRGINVVDNLATPYEKDGEKFIHPIYVDPGIHPFIASVCASAGDVAKFYKAMEDGKIVSKETFQTMLTVPKVVEEKYKAGEVILGIGYWMADLDNFIIRGNNGGITMGYSSDARIYPTEDLIVVVLANSLHMEDGFSSRQSAKYVTRQIENIFMNKPLLNLKLTSNNTDFNEASFSEEEISSLTGTYKLSPLPIPRYSGMEKTAQIYEDNGEMMIR
ncbi:MAG TPA: serine hydrolase domain-containing protein, partial [Gillisia sp.]|nr:serine hydrolase domain-containing protein [Gillisia sp.]